ncbi:hypothetical protein NIES4074_13670 [Cylindrospermum sp. NIES-4074]|nr:hypothetical protein NIES4074_13670 [Cylindrospermum sp. NIES-4074]
MGFAYKLNAGQSSIEDVAEFIIPQAGGIVHTYVMSITQEPFTSDYGFRSANSIAD